MWPRSLGCAEGVHRYEARYDYGAPLELRVKGVDAAEYILVLEASKPKTYVHDICVHCGNVKHRNDKDMSR